MLSRRLAALTLLLPALLLAGCAATPVTADGSGNPKLERISAEELARIMPKPDPKLPLESIVGMSKAGATPQEIIGRIKETGSSYALTISQAIDLNRQGVSQEVLDAVQAAREQALRDRVADEINQREAAHAEQLRREQQLRQNSYHYDPFWPGYPGYGAYYFGRSYRGFGWR